MDIYAELDNFVEKNEGQVTLTDIAQHFSEYGYQHAVDKCVWTWGEFKTAILNDECLENTDYNPIDAILGLDKHLIVHRQKGLI